MDQFINDIAVSTYYPLTDIQGTVWGYVDAGNNVVARWQYDAWGNVLNESVSIPALATLRYRFQGREWSAVTGLINFRMRWYDSETGRWLSKDPIGLGGGLNLYAFCEGSPLQETDPFGDNPAVVAAYEIVDVVVVAGAAAISSWVMANHEAMANFAKGLIDTALDFLPKGGHTKNARPSTRDKHQKGDARRQRDQQRKKQRNNKKHGFPILPLTDDEASDDEAQSDK